MSANFRQRTKAESEQGRRDSIGKEMLKVVKAARQHPLNLSATSAWANAAELAA